MKTSRAFVAICMLFAVCGSETQAEVTFDWAVVGNPGNAADPLNSAAFPGIGSVGYTYRISKTEVTNTQYVEFLNTVDVSGTNPNGIYNNGMGLGISGGISFDASAPDGNKYAVKPNMGNKPVNFVGGLDAMRFINWMENGQTAGGTETGVYSIGNGMFETRAANAHYFIPTLNEWYKAAYHQPAAQGGDSDDYWLYPTASNSVPTIASATANGDIANPGPNIANYARGADWNGQDGNVTTVGSAGPLGASFYGTFDQGGNLMELTEERYYRGGAFYPSESFLRSETRIYLPPEDTGIFQFVWAGFRVASPVPEPSTLALLSLVALVLPRRRRNQ